MDEYDVGDPFGPHQPEPPGSLIEDHTNEELDAIGKRSALPSESLPPVPAEEVRERASLVRASSLVQNPEDLDVGDWEPGNLYKGFTVLPKSEWPNDHERLHGNQKRRFYVASPSGTIGLVPWDGSAVVWPWEAAWVQSLYRPDVQSFLKDDKEKKK